MMFALNTRLETLTQSTYWYTNVLSLIFFCKNGFLKSMSHQGFDLRCSEEVHFEQNIYQK
jgi:hypothetical protein